MLGALPRNRSHLRNSWIQSLKSAARGFRNFRSLVLLRKAHFQRVSMHGVRLALVERQAETIGLPLQKMFVTRRSSNEEYLQRLTGRLLAYKAQGVTSFVFGDIILENLKRLPITTSCINVSEMSCPSAVA